jgi:hypothetical protein
VSVGRVKRYVNRLGRVLDVRRIQQEQARAEVLDAQAKAAFAEATRQQRAANYGGHEDPVGAIPYIHHRSDRALYELRGLALLDAGERAAAARGAVVDRLTDWSQAAQRVETLERLDQRRRDEHRRETQRADEREVDDLVSGRHGRSGPDGRFADGRVTGNGDDDGDDHTPGTRDAP